MFFQWLCTIGCWKSSKTCVELSQVGWTQHWYKWSEKFVWNLSDNHKGHYVSIYMFEDKPFGRKFFFKCLVVNWCQFREKRFWYKVVFGQNLSFWTIKGQKVCHILSKHIFLSKNFWNGQKCTQNLFWADIGNQICPVKTKFVYLLSYQKQRWFHEWYSCNGAQQIKYNITIPKTSSKANPENATFRTYDFAKVIILHKNSLIAIQLEILCTGNRELEFLQKEQNLLDVSKEMMAPRLLTWSLKGKKKEKKKQINMSMDNFYKLFETLIQWTEPGWAVFSTTSWSIFKRFIR